MELKKDRLERGGRLAKLIPVAIKSKCPQLFQGYQAQTEHLLRRVLKYVVFDVLVPLLVAFLLLYSLYALGVYLVA